MKKTEFMKLSEYATHMGVSYRTANRWFNAGDIAGAFRSKSGSIFVPNSAIESDKLVSPSPSDVVTEVADQSDKLVRAYTIDVAVTGSPVRHIYFTNVLRKMLDDYYAESENQKRVFDIQVHEKGTRCDTTREFDLLIHKRIYFEIEITGPDANGNKSQVITPLIEVFGPRKSRMLVPDPNNPVRVIAADEPASRNIAEMLRVVLDAEEDTFDLS